MKGTTYLLTKINYHEVSKICNLVFFNQLCFMRKLCVSATLNYRKGIDRKRKSNEICCCKTKRARNFNSYR